MSRDMIDITECPICKQNAKETRDPYTQSMLSAGYDTGESTPCGKGIRQWIHFGCAQQVKNHD